ncbi:glycine cleavage system protein GcvH [Corallococcus exiguus]|uniref:glycine cleavage system protein GcvH n=1 Tax=Corallococcus TaxID=83461 RepID=UPI000EDA1883|nr:MULTISPECIES: glycine cleavage system protein GcvH [Corallococcus]NNB90490.1 glycine cleavage system protein GcvH [Corallococcus exiguus]NNB95099.1 glycine cleavage system protein GcvH [Corallococcus exiguus]NNC03834.1 glycine cleavage system protein GcvH [Corallococcus exiguus]NPC50526.1 glycine cleavage system protein GcvH [Corallococcus exiguus]RKH77131.1 glycine cleavage system protein GcvH [Corallococcus sp. AB032C]
MADNVPQDLKYTKEHEWARVSGKIVVVGITQHASNTLGDIVYVELPKLGAQVTAGDSFGTVESVKAVSELFAPVSGKVVKVNGELAESPEDINTDPYGDGWLVEIELSDAGQLSELLDAATYETFIKE